MDKNAVVEQISSMSDKQKSKVLSIILEEFKNTSNAAEFGAATTEAFNSAIRWLM